MILGFVSDLIKMLIISYQAGDTGTAYIYKCSV